jgi:hypothetical protein
MTGFLILADVVSVTTERGMEGERRL